MKKILLLLAGLTIMLMSTGCTTAAVSEEQTSPTIDQGVFGLVLDPPCNWPPPEKPRTEPLKPTIMPNIKVQVRQYKGKQAPAGKVLKSMTSNKKGFFQFDLEEGTYFLVIPYIDSKTKGTSRYFSEPYFPGEKVDKYEIITIFEDDLVEKDIRRPLYCPW